MADLPPKAADSLPLSNSWIFNDYRSESLLDGCLIGRACKRVRETE
ncbi:MAG: hypothetical protein HYX64_03280 [Gammaproteobacteria bacterium]|nr:hypothetical protein [Gammaproteobacteria bacterium]